MDIKQKIEFPKVSGANLLRQKMTFPKDLTAKFNLMLIAFYQQQQLDINTWLPFAEQLEQQENHFNYYELPVIRGMNSVAKWFINEGMRAGIGDPKALAHTVTLYLDKKTFCSQLHIKDEKQIQIILVDHDGMVKWHTTGRFTPDKGIVLKQLIGINETLEVT